MKIKKIYLITLTIIALTMGTVWLAYRTKADTSYCNLFSSGSGVSRIMIMSKVFASKISAPFRTALCFEEVNPKLGDRLHLKFFAQPIIDAPNITMTIELPSQVTLLAGNLTWIGKLAKDQTHVQELIVRIDELPDPISVRSIDDYTKLAVIKASAEIAYAGGGKTGDGKYLFLRATKDGKIETSENPFVTATVSNELRLRSLSPTMANYAQEVDGKVYLSVYEKLTSQHTAIYQNEQKNIVVRLATEKQYGCLGYQINADSNFQGNSIEVDIRNITSPQGACAMAFGPAVFSKGLGKPEGIYRLSLLNKGKRDEYDVIISDQYISLNPISTSFTDVQDYQVVRFPISSIVVECLKNQGDLCVRFLKDLTALGAVKSVNQEYANYLLQKHTKRRDINSLEAEPDQYTYSGDMKSLENLIIKYSKQDESMIGLYVWSGENYFTWVERRELSR